MPRDDIGPTEWYFIASPLKVSWSKGSSVEEINTYGSNSSYMVYGTTKLRTLTLNECLVEGFTDGKTIEDNITQLEECMKIHADENSGMVSPYCWYLYSGAKSYGVYLLTNVEVNEVLRDNSGNATRSVVNMSMQEVAPYQVVGGQDLASKGITGSFDPETEKKIKELSKKKEQEGGSGINDGSGEVSSKDEPPKPDQERSLVLLARGAFRNPDSTTADIVKAANDLKEAGEELTEEEKQKLEVAQGRS